MKKKFLVISSYRRPCGIAQYVEHLEPALREALAPDFEVEIAQLDVGVLRARTGYARKLAAGMIEDLVKKAKSSDVVNIQLEPGLFGCYPFTVIRRLRKLIKASKKVLLTHHTLMNLKDSYLPFSFSSSVVKDVLVSYWRTMILRWLYAQCQKERSKFYHIVQTELDYHSFELFGFPRSSTARHPLAFISQSDKEHWRLAQQDLKRALIGDDPELQLLGVFGFLSEYKGIEVAVKAMDYLPDRYHLAIVGGLHPEGIQPNTIQQHYIDMLLSIIDPITHARNRECYDERVADAVQKRIARIHFIGAVGNLEFTHWMNSCDIVVLPYAEVGQKSSGPASMALDLGKRMFCSRNVVFNELNRLADGAFEQFEIGNHLELSQKIQRPDTHAARRRTYSAAFNLESRAHVYRLAANVLVADGDRSF